MAEPPPLANVLGLFQKCRQQYKDLSFARHVHAYMCQYQLESHKFLGNGLVPLLVCSGSLPEAQQVFCRLPHRTELSWSTLISAHVDDGEPQQALHLFCRMQEDHVHPSDYTYVALLRAFVKLNAVERGRGIHCEVIKFGWDIDPFIGNTLVDFYGKCALHPEALQVFDRLIFRDTVSWNALITGFTEHGDGEEVLTCYKKMRKDAVPPGLWTFPCILKACGITGRLQAGQEVHHALTRAGFERDLFVVNALIDMYAKYGGLEDAHQVFDKALVRDTVSWNALIAGYTEHGFAEEALTCFKQMQVEDVSPGGATFACSLKACGTLGALQTGQELHMQITKRGLERDEFVGTTLVDMYAKCNLLTEANKVFDKLPIRDDVLWNSLIAAHIENGSADKALDCFEQMQLEVMSMCAATVPSGLKACGMLGALETGLKMHSELTKRGLEKNILVANTLVDMYGKCGVLGTARQMFGMLPARDAVSWNVLIAGYAEHGFAEEASQCLKEMQLEGVSQVAGTFVSSLKACGAVGALEIGQGLHSEVTKRGLEKDILVGTTLVDMYAKCGLFAEVRQLFDRLPVQDAISWNALIAGYLEWGYSEEALDCFRKMQLEGRPLVADIIPCSLKACGIMEALETGLAVHSEIIMKGLEIGQFVANSLIDMYAKCDSLPAARQVFDNLPVQDVISWNALIAGYMEHGFLEEALKCLKQMQSKGVAPEAVTFMFGLNACGMVGDLERGQELYSEAVQRGFERDVCVANALVQMYGNCGSLSEGHQICDGLHLRDSALWNALIVGYAENGSGEEVLKILKHMLLEALSPDSGTFSSSLKVCGMMRTLETGLQIHAEVVKRGLERDPFVANTLVDMYGKCDSMVAAHLVFDQLSVRDTISWNVLIAAYAERGFSNEVLNCYKQMQLEAVSPVIATYACCLKACGLIGAVETGQALHAEIIKKGLQKETCIVNSLVDMYGKCGLIADGQLVFEKLSVRDAVSWSAMIKGYGKNYNSDMVVRCFADMQKEGVKPNAVTLTCLLSACSHSNMVLQGQEYFQSIVEAYEIEPTFDHCACIIDLLARSGYVSEAERFAEAMHLLSYEGILRALLTASKIHGEVEVAVRCFQQLVHLNTEDATPYLLMADIYASAGRWSDANRIEEMRKDIGARKKLANASIELNKELHEFSVGGNKNQNIMLTETLEIVNSQMKSQGYVPCLDIILTRVFNQDNDSAETSCSVGNV